MKRLFFLCLIVTVFFSLSSSSFADERGRYGIGFQASFPAFGLSGVYDIDEKIAVQAVLGFFGGVNTYSLRGLYRFLHDDYWNLYGYGSLGLWTHKWGLIYSDKSVYETESVFGFGFGAGIEYDWRMINEKFPPIFWNVEIGVNIVGFEHYSLSALGFGAGFHFRF